MPEDNHYLDVKDITDDFGFTFANESDVVSANPVYSSLEEETADLKKRLAAVNKIFMPLLENLMKDPDKPFIKWPNRKEVIEKQIVKLKSLTNVKFS